MVDRAIRAEKADLRERAQANRVGLEVDSDRVCRGLAHFIVGLRPGWIVLFDAMAGEPDLASLLEADLGRDFALTRTPDEGRVLSVHPVRAPREVHRFGYSQPVADAPIVADGDIAAVCVPALAFDRHGGRLGFGAGFYDRFLARLAPGVVRIGVTNGFIVDRIPSEPHDIPMTHLAGEFGVVALPLDTLP